MIKNKEHTVEVVVYYPDEKTPTDFKISDVGYFCITKPYKMVVGNTPITDYGITSMDQLEKKIHGSKFIKLIFKK